MEEKDLPKRLEELESRISDLDHREKRLRNVALKLSAVVMTLSEKLQEKKLLRSDEFERRVQAHLKTLDREISDRRTLKLLEDLFDDTGDHDPEE